MSAMAEPVLAETVGRAEMLRIAAPVTTFLAVQASPGLHTTEFERMLVGLLGSVIVGVIVHLLTRREDRRQHDMENELRHLRAKLRRIERERREEGDA